MRRPDAEAGVGFRLGPVRRYPGQPLWPEDLPPDFNGDGYTDLLLWRTQAPAPTVNALSRAIAGGTWPVDLSIHLYDPAAASFSPRASGAIRVDTPIARFFDASPAIIPHAIILGFGSDGTRGLACATGETIFTVWRWQAGGLSAVPVFQMKSGEPIDGVVFHTPLAEGSDEAVGLRTASRLILLRPSSMLLDEAGLQDPATRARIRYLRGLVESP